MAKEKKKATSQKAASKQSHPYQNPNHDNQTSNRFQQQNGSQNGIQNQNPGSQRARFPTRPSGFQTGNQNPGTYYPNRPRGQWSQGYNSGPQSYEGQNSWNWNYSWPAPRFQESPRFQVSKRHVGLVVV